MIGIATNNGTNTLHKSLTIVFLVVSILISGFSADLGRAQSSAPESMVTLTPEEKAWLAQHPEIILGTTTEYSPMVFRKMDGTYGGMLVDIYEEVNRRLNTRIHLHIEDPWSKVQEKAQNREIDGLAMGGKSPDRDVLFNATDVIVPTYFSVFARSQEEYRLKRFSDLKGMRIGYKRAARPTRALLEKLPSAVLKPYDDHESLTQALLRKEIDVVVAWISYDHWRKEKLQGTIENILFIEEFPIEMVTHIRKDWPELIPILNKTIASLQQDELPRLINKWFGQYPRQSTATKAPLTSAGQAWLKTQPTVVARVGNFPPFHFMDQGKPTGFSIDLMDRIAEQAGFNVRYVSGVSWPEGLEHVRRRDGEVDVLLTAMNTPERREFMAFTNDYLELPFKIFTRDDDESIGGIDDLIGKTVAIEKGYAVAKIIRRQYPGIRVMEVAGYAPEALRTVSLGKADAYIGNQPVANYHIIHLGLVNLKVAANTPFGFHTHAFGVRKDWPEFVTVLDKLLAAIPFQERVALQEKWGLSEWKQAEAVTIRGNLSDEEKAWLAQNHTIRVRFNQHPPYFYLKDGKVVGLAVDFLNKVSEHAGITFQLGGQSHFSDLINGLIEHKGPDLVSAIMPTPKREEVILFTKPFITSPRFIFTRDDAPFISSIENLFGQQIAVVNGYATHTYLAENYSNIDLLAYNTADEALRAVSSGKAMAYIGDIISTPAIINEFGLKNLKAACPSGLPDHPLAMGVRNDWPELRDILDKALAAMPAADKAAIVNKWTTVKVEHGIKLKDVVIWGVSIFIAGSIIIFMFLFWNRQLRREVSRRKETELALKRAKDEAEAANQAKSSFLASMSHELRTPLNAILGFSRMLSQEQKINADQQEKLGIINRSGQHLLSMINDVLDLSKIESETIELKKRSFDLTALINEISVMLQSRATEKGVTLEVETEKVSFPYIKTDDGKLRQILINLLSNAVKFTDEGGATISYITESIPDEPNRCLVTIEVEDTGPGIDPARREKIFEPFVQESDMPERKGTGLGLSICKKYVEFMGGTIELESELGKGSLFRVRLSAKIAETPDVKTPVDIKPRVIGLAQADKTWRILVTDDNRENLLLLRSLLEEVGFYVIEANNGKEALDAFKKESPDLIWMDMRMPVMDGYEAVRQIRKWEEKLKAQSSKLKGKDAAELSAFSFELSARAKRVPIIAITASAFKEQRREIIAAGCDDVVIKPFKAHEIFEVMSRFLDIEYNYESDDDLLPARTGKSDLTSAMLTELPAELLNDLRQATLALDREAISAVIDRIEPLAPDTAKGLRTLLDEFQIGRIRDLLGEVEG